MSYVYVRSEGPPAAEHDLWTVGHYRPGAYAAEHVEARFVPESYHTTTDAAAARVHYLNGGCNSGTPHYVPGSVPAVRTDPTRGKPL